MCSILSPPLVPFKRDAFQRVARPLALKGRQNIGGGKQCVAPDSSFIIHHSSFIIHHSSFTIGYAIALQSHPNAEQEEVELLAIVNDF